MSLLLILIWLGYETYQASNSLPLALVHSGIVLILVLFYEFCKLAFLPSTTSALKSITVYPFGGLSNSDRSLALEHVQSDTVRKRTVRQACIPPVVLALLALTLFAALKASPGNELLYLAFITATTVSMLLLLPVTPYPGGRLFKLVCEQNKSIPRFLPTTLKFITLVALGVFAAQSDSVTFLIVSAVYISIALEQHIFERSRNAAARFTAREALFPIESLVSFPHSSSCEFALSKALRSFQPVFPVFHMKEPIGYVEKNSLLQITEDGFSPPVSDVTIKTVSRVSPETPLALILSIFRESQTPLLFVFNENNECVGLLIKEKVLEFLVIKSAEAHLDLDDFEDPSDPSDTDK